MASSRQTTSQSAPTPRTPEVGETTDSPAPEVMSTKLLAKAGVAGSDLAVLNANALEFSDEELRNVTTFEDAMQLVASSNVPVADASQVLGNGFSVLNDKNKLIDVPCFLVSWQFHEGEIGQFVSVHLLAQMPGMGTAKFIINDGSKGICRQLSEYTKATGRNGGLVVRRGLRRSDYTVTDPQTGEPKSATTFYLDTSA